MDECPCTDTNNVAFGSDQYTLEQCKEQCLTTAGCKEIMWVTKDNRGGNPYCRGYTATCTPYSEEQCSSARTIYDQRWDKYIKPSEILGEDGWLKTTVSVGSSFLVSCVAV